MKKTISIFILVTLIFSLINRVNAQSIYLYSTHNVDARFAYNGMEVITAYVEYDLNGTTYPAYCLDKTLDGVHSGSGYNVETEPFDIDSEYNQELWRIITNGYPYVSFEALGCATAEEAFAATKQAVYCHIHGNDPNLYTGIDDAGARVANAIRTILQRAANDSLKYTNADIIFAEVELPDYDTMQNGWAIDNTNKRLLKKYKINISSKYSNLNISIDNPNFTLLNNNFEEATNFPNNEFILSIPINSNLGTQNVNINVQANIETKSLIYGSSNNASTQDYMLTSVPDVHIEKTLSQTIEITKTYLKIVKINEERQYLDGVEFNIYDSNSNLVYEKAVTDENGTIKVELPIGKYYIQEVKTKSGYVLNDQLISVNVEYNKLAKIVLLNVKEEEPEEPEEPIVPEKTEPEEEVEEKEEVIIPDTEIKNETVKKLPVTGY